ncbi:MAG: serine/threonine protein kinase [Deltaproteobacteria bacterium]|nr:serine/threonine protein kinase [Deltaproteobacteria bacterium]
MERTEPAPRVLGKYRILAELGHGGMARVYLAVAHGLSGFSKLVVLKTIRVHLHDEIDAVGMFLDEARVAGRLNHPNVVQTYEIAEYDGQHVLVMEYLDGQPLSVILKRAREQKTGLTVPMCLRVVIEALNGLHYVHELRDFDGTPMNLVHRDVSPQNIFVTYDGQVKVLDFGIAKAVTSSTETKAGVVKGKVAYMAAEQFLDEPIDRRVDIFAMGAVLWHVATGKRLWKGDADGRIVNRVIQGDIPTPSSINPNVHPGLEKVVLKAMARERDDRYATAMELQQDVEKVLEEMRAQSTIRDVGTNVASTFADVRAHLTAAIERQLSHASSASPDSDADLGTVPRIRGMSVGMVTTTGGSLSTGGSTVTPASGSNPGGAWAGKVDSASMHRVLADPATVETAAHSSSRRTTRVLAVVGVCLALLIAASALLITAARNSNATAGPAASSAPAPFPSPSDFAASPADSAADAAKPGEVLLTLSGVPPTSRLFFDDAPLASNPSTRRLAQDGSTHKVRAEAHGYETKTIDVTADRDQAISIVLERPLRPGETRPPVKASSDPGSKTPPASTPTTPDTTKTAPTASTPRDRIKTIDKSNPWD